MSGPGPAGGCGCCGPTAAQPNPTDAEQWSEVRARAAQEAVGGSSDIVCTLAGGTDAMRDRITEWQQVIAAAAGRETAEGGITLVYDHDPAVTVQLARLAAAEFACCSFFTFTLTVGPDGMRFTVTAPDEAADVVTAVFGTAPATLAPSGGN